MRVLKSVLAVCVLVLIAGCASAPSPQAAAPAANAAQGSSAQAAAAPTPASAPAAQPAATPPKSDIWPKIYDDETYLTDFASTLSEAEAVGSIKNLQNSFVEYGAGIPISSLDVDPYGLRAKWQWTENNFVKSASLIIPFDQVASILLEQYPKLNLEYKWGIIVYMTGGNKSSLRTPTRDSAERLGKAIAALAKARNAPLSMPNMRFGAALGALTDAQAQAAGILKDAGVIVLWIFRESPAEKAGFSPQDIVTSVGGAPIHTGADLFAAIDAAAAAGATQLKIDGLRRSYRVDGGKYIEIFVPLTYVLPIEQAGGAK